MFVLPLSAGAVNYFKITDPGGGTSAYFGTSIAVSGNYAIIGAHDTNKKGAAYIFEKNASNIWEQKAILTSSDSAEGDRFGISVDISENYAVVGAEGNNQKGAVYVFKKVSAEAGWISTDKETKKLSDLRGKKFGSSVAILEKSEGNCIIIAGSPSSDGTGLTSSGAAFVFNCKDTTWTALPKLAASDAKSYDYFGTSVDITDDAGIIYAVVGAVSGDSGDLTTAGAAYVFEIGDTSSTQKGKLTASDPSNGAGFGTSVALVGDTAAIGSPAKNAVYVFQKGAGWIDSSSSNKIDGPAAGEYFGKSISISENYILIGTKVGNKAYLYNKTDLTTPIKTLSSNDSTSGDSFGSAVAISEISGDYYAVIGAPGDYISNVYSGSLYFYSTSPFTSYISDISDLTVNKSTVENPTQVSTAFTLCTSKLVTITASSDNPSVISPDQINFYDGLIESDRTYSNSEIMSEADCATIILTIKPSDQGSSGTANITLAVDENGVQVASVTFKVSVTSQPDILPIDPVVANKTNPQKTITFQIDDPDTLPSKLTIIVTSSNQALVSDDPEIPINRPLDNLGLNTYELVITPVADASSGTCTITITVSDGNSAADSESFSFTLTDAPGISEIPDQETQEDTTKQVGFTVDDDSPLSSLKVTAVSNNSSLISAIKNINGTPGSVTNQTKWTMDIVPVPYAFGDATITITVVDGDLKSTTESFKITVNAVPTNPIISNIPNPPASDEDVTISGINFTVKDVDIKTSGDLTISAKSSNTDLIPDANITINGIDQNGVVTVLAGEEKSLSLDIVPAKDLWGTSTITLTVSAERQTDTGTQTVSSEKTFTVTVNKLEDDNPVIDKIIDTSTTVTDGFITGTTIKEGEQSSAIEVSVSDPDKGFVSVEVTSSNEDLLPNDSAHIKVAGFASPHIVDTSAGSIPLKLTLAPIAEQWGSSVITITATDSSELQLVSSKTFLLTVTQVNDPPVISVIENQVLTENESFLDVSFDVSDMDGDALTITATTKSPNDPSVTESPLLPNANISINSSTNTTTVPTTPGVKVPLIMKLTPVAGLSGSAEITVNVNDGTVDVSTTFLLSVNFALGISDIADQTTKENINPSISFNITGLNSPDNAIITATSSNPMLVLDSNISVNSLGSGFYTLDIILEPDVIGTATIFVKVEETVSGQIRTAADSFLLTVESVNNPPAIEMIVDPDDDPDIYPDSKNITTNVGTAFFVKFRVYDIETPAKDLIVNFESVDSYGDEEDELVPAGAFSIVPSDPATDGIFTILTLKFQPATGAYGDATITVTVKDERNATDSDSFNLLVYNNNYPPEILEIEQATDPGVSIIDKIITIEENNQTDEIQIYIADKNSDVLTVTVRAEEGSEVILNDADHINIDGVGVKRIVSASDYADGYLSLMITPEPFKTGSTTITVEVKDTSGETVTKVFYLDVVPSGGVNLVPKITDIKLETGESIINQVITIEENTPSPIIQISLSDGNQDPLKVSVSSTEGSDIIPNDAAHIDIDGVGNERNVSYADYGGDDKYLRLVINPAADKTGSATIVVKATDDKGAIAQKTFYISVKLSDAPRITFETTLDPDNVTMPEDTTFELPFWISSVRGGVMELSVQSENLMLNPDHAKNIYAEVIAKQDSTISNTGGVIITDIAVIAGDLVSINGAEKFIVEAGMTAVQVNADDFISVYSQADPETARVDGTASSSSTITGTGGTIPTNAEFGNVTVEPGDYIQLNGGTYYIVGTDTIPAIKIKDRVTIYEQDTHVYLEIIGDKLDEANQMTLVPTTSYPLKLAIDPADNANSEIARFGKAEIFITIKEVDGDKLELTKKITLYVEPVDDAPKFTIQYPYEPDSEGDYRIMENGEFNVVVMVENVDEDLAGDNITVNVESRNTNLVPNNVSNLRIGNEFFPYEFTLTNNHTGSFKLTVTPAPDVSSDIYDNARIVLGVGAEGKPDAQNQFFSIEVIDFANPPQINQGIGIENQIMNEDDDPETINPLKFTISDPDWDTLIVTVNSGSQDLLPDQNITVTGQGISIKGDTPIQINTNPGGTFDLSLTFAPVDNGNSEKFGDAPITITIKEAKPAEDNPATISETFDLTVTPRSDPPEFNPEFINIGISIPECTPTACESVKLSDEGIDIDFKVRDVDRGILTITAVTTDNKDLIPDNNIIIYALGGEPGLKPGYFQVPLTSDDFVPLDIEIKPALHQAGVATIKVEVSDGTNTKSQDIIVSVTNENEIPEIVSIDLSTTQMNEDNSLPITFQVRDWDMDTLTILAESDNETLFERIEINNNEVPFTQSVLAGEIVDMTLKLTGAKDQFGEAVITLSVNDFKAPDVKVSRTFKITVNNLNDPPEILPVTGAVGDVKEEQDPADIPALLFRIKDIDGGDLKLSVESTLPKLEKSSILIGGILPDGSFVNGDALSSMGIIVEPNIEKELFLKIAPPVNLWGPGMVMVTVTDQDADSATGKYTFNILPEPDDPSIKLDPYQGTTPDTEAIEFKAIFGDVDGDQVTLTVNSLDQAFLPNSNIRIEGEGNSITTGTTIGEKFPITKTITLTPIKKTRGNVDIEVIVKDFTGREAREIYTLMVTTVNEIIAISGADTQYIVSEADGQYLSFLITDQDTPESTIRSMMNVNAVPPNADKLTVGEPELQADSSGYGIYWYKVPVKSAANVVSQTTSDTIGVTVWVSDGENFAEKTFQIFVAAPGTAPSITGYNNEVVINEDEETTINFTITDNNTDSSGITVRVYPDTNDDGYSLVPSTNIDDPVFLPDQSSPGIYKYKVTFRPAKDKFSVDNSDFATIYIEARDDRFTVRKSFTVTVIAINDPPEIKGFTDSGEPYYTTTDENVGIVIPPSYFSISDPDGGLLFISVTGTQNLVPSSSIDIRDTEGRIVTTSTIEVASGIPQYFDMVIRPLTNVTGTATITLKVTDDSGSTNPIHGSDTQIIYLEIGDVIDGDVNNDKKVDLADAVLGLQIMTGINVKNINLGADINENMKIGMEEVIYIMRTLQD
ncbi:Integrine FG-GAP repeat-containing protein [Desulfonema limicola]|uniref:Integrine FG-GAP repeat-containing protein n=1 Tax=Desulfonema limicola TaxID=45656 RepID=A0A975BBE8_9BACT|nr:Integrine FG-GAP repeat-containing protein [Desulfonema limicola]